MDPFEVIDFFCNPYQVPLVGGKKKIHQSFRELLSVAALVTQQELWDSTLCTYRECLGLYADAEALVKKAIEGIATLVKLISPERHFNDKIEEAIARVRVQSNFCHALVQQAQKQVKATRLLRQSLLKLAAGEQGFIATVSGWFSSIYRLFSSKYEQQKAKIVIDENDSLVATSNNMVAPIGVVLGEFASKLESLDKSFAGCLKEQVKGQYSFFGWWRVKDAILPKPDWGEVTSALGGLMPPSAQGIQTTKSLVQKIFFAGLADHEKIPGLAGQEEKSCKKVHDSILAQAVLLTKLVRDTKIMAELIKNTAEAKAEMNFGMIAYDFGRLKTTATKIHKALAEHRCHHVDDSALASAHGLVSRFGACQQAAMDKNPKALTDSIEIVLFELTTAFH